MLLPQSAAFAALKNRLNSVSAIGYLHIAPRTYVSSPSSSSGPTRAGSVTEIPSFIPHRNSVMDSSHIPRNSVTASATTSTYDRPNRLKGRDEGIRWGELLDKFRSVQERARRAQRTQNDFDEGFSFPDDKSNGCGAGTESKTYNNMVRLPGPPQPPMKDPPSAQQHSPVVSQRAKLGLGKFGRLGAGPSKLKK